MSTAAPISHAAYRAFGLEPSASYVEACAKLRAGLIPCELYARPADKAKGTMRDMASRGPFVRQCADGTKRGRLVREHCCKRTHIEQACSAQPPSRAETSLQAAAEPAVGAAQTLRVLSARVLPPQPLQLQLRVGGWLGRELATVRRRRCRPRH